MTAAAWTQKLTEKQSEFGFGFVCMGFGFLCLTFTGRETLPCVWDLTVEKERLCLVHLHLLGHFQRHYEVGPE